MIDKNTYYLQLTLIILFIATRKIICDLTIYSKHNSLCKNKTKSAMLIIKRIFSKLVLLLLNFVFPWHRCRLSWIVKIFLFFIQTNKINRPLWKNGLVCSNNLFIVFLINYNTSWIILYTSIFYFNCCKNSILMLKQVIRLLFVILSSYIFLMRKV